MVGEREPDAIHQSIAVQPDALVDLDSIPAHVHPPAPLLLRQDERVAKISSSSRKCSAGF
ncbi:MAG TPA: hypothetical protein DEP84_26240 [Chloroflexi bacterium]|nr:hypothetical protein [Chloroflexota bacterium]